MNLVQALAQALDFVWKACREYADTEQGKKELNDVISALDPDFEQSVQAESASFSSTLEEARKAYGKVK